MGDTALEKPSASSPDFPLAAETIAELPDSVFVKNSSGQPVLAYVVRWTHKDNSGEEVVQKVGTYNLASPEPSDVLAPCATHLVSIVTGSVAAPGAIRIGPAEQARVANLRLLYADRDPLFVSLDLVIFRSGMMMGADVGGSGNYIKAFIEARDEVFALFAKGALVGDLETLMDDQTRKRALADASGRGPLSFFRFDVLAQHASSYTDAFELLRAYHAGRLLQRVHADGEREARESVQKYTSFPKYPKIFRESVE